MQNSESITVSLEWAKKLKEAGWPQEEPLSFWAMDTKTAEPVVRFRSNQKSINVVWFAAPTAEEILRRLPRDAIKQEENTEKWFIEFGFYGRREKGYVVHLHEPVMQKAKAICEADTLANAAAAMYCYLADHHLLP